MQLIKAGRQPAFIFKRNGINRDHQALEILPFNILIRYKCLFS